MLLANEEASEEETVSEVVKELVFIEQHLAEDGVLDGIESPYDVQVSPDGGHVYVASLKNDAIAYFGRDQENGELSYLGYVSQSDIGEDTLNGVRSLAISPDGSFLYGVSMFSNDIAAFSRDDSTGALSLIGSIYDTDGGVDGLDGGRSVAISPDGKNLYVAAYDDSKVSVFSRDGTTGAIGFLAVYEEGDQDVEELSQPHAISVSPDGKHVYVALWKNEIVVFERNSSTGLLSYVSKLSYLEGESKTLSPRDLAFSPDGAFAYVVSSNNDALSVFSRDSETGELTLEETVFNNEGGVIDLDGPHALSISSDGKYVYVAAFSSDSVTSFERDSTTGLVSYYQSISAEAEDTWDMNGPISIGTSPDGEHVYVGSGSGTHSVVTFRRESLVDPPEFVVQPVAVEIEEGEDAAFYALAQGVELSYQWMKNGSVLSGKTLPVLSLPAVSSSEDGVEYSVKVSNAGGSVTSGSVGLTVLPPIVVEAPEDLTALNISSSSAQLAWKDLSDNETSFELQRRTSGGEFTSIGTASENQTGYEDDTLDASTKYFYRLRAKRLTNVSLWSNDAVIESYDDVPQPPVNLQVKEQTYNKVLLAWSDRSAVEDGFLIYRRIDDLGSTWELVDTIDKDATRYEDRAVVADATYAYRILAFNESGNSEYSNSVVAITGSNPVDTISPVSRVIPAEEIRGYSISVSSSDDWEAVSNVDWLIVTSPTDGEGTENEGVVYRSRLNESQDERTGEIVVGGIEHTVTQEGSPPFLKVNPSKVEKDASEGIALIEISANVDWAVSESSEWVSISSGQSGEGSGVVSLHLDENRSFENRFAELEITSSDPTIADRSYTVEQAGNVEIFEVTVSESSFTSSGGNGSVTVSSNIAWNASSSVSWLSLESELSGEGDGEFTFILEENAEETPRSADIVVNDTAITITQEAVLVSDVEAPEWVRVTVGPLGAELVWTDLSETESGFRIRRSIVGSERVVDVVELEADTTSYFDRDAPRGETVEYRLVSFDGIGESDEVLATSEQIPSANLTAVALRVESSGYGTGFFAGFDLAGKGEMGMQYAGKGTAFQKLDFGKKHPSGRYEMDTDGNEFRYAGSVSNQDWESYFSMRTADAELSFSSSADRLEYAAWSLDSSTAYSRGGRVLGELLNSESAIVFGFEIEGEMELPILIQGVGKSLADHAVADWAGDLKLELYEVSGEADRLAVNADWRVWTNETAITLDDAIVQTNAIASLSESGGEARILISLGTGRYLAVLTSSTGKTGHAMLEVKDAR